MEDCAELPSPSTTEIQHCSEIGEPTDPPPRHPFLDFFLKVESWFGRVQIALKWRR